MPYILLSDRERVQIFGAKTSGELNYLITLRLIAAKHEHANPLALSKMKQEVLRAALSYWNSAKVQNYATINDIMGALAGAIMEFDRRTTTRFGDEEAERKAIARALSKAVYEFYYSVAAPYEDQKIISNTDVYP